MPKKSLLDHFPNGLSDLEVFEFKPVEPQVNRLSKFTKPGPSKFSLQEIEEIQALKSDKQKLLESCLETLNKILDLAK